MFAYLQMTGTENQTIFFFSYKIKSINPFVLLIYYKSLLPYLFIQWEYIFPLILAH